MQGPGLVPGGVVQTPPGGPGLVRGEDLLLGQEGGAQVRDLPGGPPALTLQRAVGRVRGVRGPRRDHGPGAGLTWGGRRMVSQ